MTTRQVQGNKWRLNRIEDYYYLVNDNDLREDAKIYCHNDGFALSVYTVRGNLIFQQDGFISFEEAAKKYDAYRKAGKV